MSTSAGSRTLLQKCQTRSVTFPLDVYRDLQCCCVYASDVDLLRLPIDTQGNDDRAKMIQAQAKGDDCTLNEGKEVAKGICY